MSQEQPTRSALLSRLFMLNGLTEAPPGWAFSGRDSLIAEHGKDYRWAPHPEELQRGEIGHCFANAAHFALQNSAAIYVEGYALVHGVALHHAWCTYDGLTAVDPTWRTGTDYFGVPLKTSFVSERANERGYYGVFADMPDAVEFGWYQNGLPSEALA